MPSGVVLKLLKTAATNIPWRALVQNAPVVVELVERVRERLGAGASHGLADELEAMREEQLKLADALLESSARVAALEKALEVLSARLKLMTALGVLALIAAGTSLIIVLSR
ncbi:hypothetical protein GMSM_35360 [Geomonas sp. Red276]